MGGRDLERAAWPWSRIPLSATLEGVRVTSVLATTWFVLGAVLGQGAEAAEEMQNQLVGLGGLVALAAGTAVETGLAVKKARSAD